MILRKSRLLMALINKIPFLHDAVQSAGIKHVVSKMPNYHSYYDRYHYATVEGLIDENLWPRSLPAIPQNCPTPMGVAGPKQLPSALEVAEKFFQRPAGPKKLEKFGTNMFFVYFVQHGFEMFMRSKDAAGSEGVTMSNVYGRTQELTRMLRSGVDGKLKSQIVNGEEWPLFAKDVPGYEKYFEGAEIKSMKQVFAVGLPKLNSALGRLAFAVLNVREHNRICDQLKAIHTEYDDDQLFETARMILTAETVKLVAEYYINHLARINLRVDMRPEHDVQTKWQIPIEFSYVHGSWQSALPEEMKVPSTGADVSSDDYVDGPEKLIRIGMDEFVKMLLTTRAGRLIHHNHEKFITHAAAMAIEESRHFRLQSLNNYRKFHLGITPHKTFLDMTGGDKEAADTLEQLYGDVDAVEYYVGLFAETSEKTLSPDTHGQMALYYALKIGFGNPIHPRFWIPSTFGGKVGWNHLNKQTLRGFVCDNLKECPSRTTFTVHGFKDFER